MNDKIEGLLAEGRALLASGRPRDAALVFERVLLLAPADPAAREGVEAAHAAVAEHERDLDARFEAAENARIPTPGWFSLRRSEGDGSIPPAPAISTSGRARLALGVVCGAFFLVLGAAVAANWDGLLRRLEQAPRPQQASVSYPVDAQPRAEDQTIAAARRHLEEGDPARAVALLDSVHPHQPSYPFARQLRGQAEQALRRPRRQR